MVVLSGEAGRRKMIWGGLTVLFALSLCCFRARAEIPREYQLKAVFLYNFARFTEWPTNTFVATNSPIVIGILGADPFGSFLDETVRGEVVQGRRLVVERYQRAEEIQSCHILFISQSESPRLEQHLNLFRGRPVLTVSDIDNAAIRGVIVRLITESNKIRLRVNLDSLNASKLVLSSKLLRAAEIVSQNGGP
jgi:hypothetical protein